ncbi:MAG: hypothetical protein A2277_17360 [Desulfobacterales bacterium RIFOXYA12_FULL_46_15]|nr:MAG: hypothetical protein A2277_17360 [Desulfobacterales bacterium RIFOXYA12_FULL_46_15]
MRNHGFVLIKLQLSVPDVSLIHINNNHSYHVLVKPGIFKIFKYLIRHFFLMDVLFFKNP